MSIHFCIMHNRKIGNYTKLENFKRNTYTYNRVYISQRPHNLRNNWVLCWFMLITFLLVYNLTFIQAVRMNEDTTNKIEEFARTADLKLTWKFQWAFLITLCQLFSLLSIPTRTQFQPTFVQIILGFKELIFFQMKDKALFQPEVIAK